jgi:hypothetical protein
MVKLLSDFRADTYSQFGEDGMIAEVFRRMPPLTRVSVEFGAWDGFHLANTARLFVEEHWRAFLIEGDPERFELLKRNVAEFDCVCVNDWVRPNGPHSLERILVANGLAVQPDILSIDIDGDDYLILEGLERLRPRLILCEYNPTIPPQLDLHAPLGTSFGSSASAIIRVAVDLGYRLIGLTDTNCFFVPEGELPLFSDLVTDADQLFSNRYLSYVATGYNGQYILINRGPYGLASPLGQPMAGADAALVVESPFGPQRRTIVERLRSRLGL